MTSDPYEASGEADEPATFNRYNYANGDPANLNDPSGLSACGAEYSFEQCFGPGGPMDHGILPHEAPWRCWEMIKAMGINSGYGHILWDNTCTPFMQPGMPLLMAALDRVAGVNFMGLGEVQSVGYENGLYTLTVTEESYTSAVFNGILPGTAVPFPSGGPGIRGGNVIITIGVAMAEAFRDFLRRRVTYTVTCHIHFIGQPNHQGQTRINVDVVALDRNTAYAEGIARINQIAAARFGASGWHTQHCNIYP